MKRKASALLTALFTVLSAAWLWPLLVVFLNSLKKKAYISRAPFALPSARTWAGFANYEKGLELTGFIGAAFWSAVITLLSVGLILLCTSMCAWYISRVPGRGTHAVYLACVFSMVVPFQMVMFTLSKVANLLALNTPWTIPVIYLGFGAGLSVFIFTGSMRSVPLAIEESAMIDGCGPLRIFFSVTAPVLQPVMVSVGT